MEKLPLEKQNQISQQYRFSNSELWDCGNTLYRSFEHSNSLKIETLKLNSAIISNSSRRTLLSMSHLRERGLLPVPLQPLSSTPVVTKKPFNISRSFQKFLRFVFKSSNSNNKSTVSSCSNSISFQVPEKYSKERVYVVYDKSGPVLSTIPEVPEFEIGAAISPEMVTRSASELFTTTAVGPGISCA